MVLVLREYNMSEDGHKHVYRCGIFTEYIENL